MQGVKRIFSEAEVEYLKAHFADTKNAELAAHLRCGETTLHRTARKMGLKKSAEHMKRCQRHTAEQAAKANRASGGNAGKANLLKYGTKYQFKKGTTNADRLGVEAEKRRMQKAVISRNETIRRERMRINWGLPQRTRLKLTSNKSQIYTRHALKIRGYLVSRGAKVIYYSNETQRNTTVEDNAAMCGLKILPYEQSRTVS